MARIAIPRRGWVLVCDGGRALILQNEGDAELVNLKLVEVLGQHVPPAHALGSDRPGRVHQSVGASRSAVAMVDLHEAAEREFLQGIVRVLTGLLHERQARSLVIVAPPRALGVVRAALPASLITIVTHELPLDLVALPIPQIERHLAGG